MGKEFIKSQRNKTDIQDAARQEQQLSYFTQSQLQENHLPQSYINQWAERYYSVNDYFLNYIKSVFKTENFLAFFKYLRKPLPSAKLINNKVKPQLNRVFVAENADYKYDVSGVDKGEIKETLHTKKFEEELFNKLLFNHNSIVIEDLKGENEPFRFFLNIEDVVSLDHDCERITRIAFGAAINVTDESGGIKTINGFVYIDDFVYAFYDKEFKLLIEEPHDLGICPADFISKNKYKDNFIVRESLFTYVREELEEYTFLKTLQKMVEPNGSIPVVTKLDTDNSDTKDTDIDGSKGEPVSPDTMGSKTSEVFNEVNNAQKGELQAGNIINIPVDAVRDANENLNMDVVKNYFNFFYLPTEALNYLNTRISEVENSIVTTLVGSAEMSNEEAKNETQVEKSIITLENTLIWIAESLNRIRTSSDTKMLGLKYGIKMVNEVFIFYGTDFLLESASKLFDDLAKAPNAIERKNILIRINQNKYKNNKDQQLRQKILYDLLPYLTDVEFEIARNTGISNETLQYQLRFDHWITLFEATYGDIVSFYIGMDTDEATKLRVINELILQIITLNTTNDNNINNQLT